MNTSPRVSTNDRNEKDAQDPRSAGVGEGGKLVSDVLQETRQFLGAPLRDVASAVTEAPLEVAPTATTPESPEPVIEASPRPEPDLAPPDIVQADLEPDSTAQEPMPELVSIETDAETCAPEREGFSILALPRALSPRWKRIVNVAAITLAAWVPIAWAIAWF